MLVLLALFALFGTITSDPPKYEWAGCDNLGTCKTDGYSTPPLLILSFDGFAREYLDRKIVKSLEKIAECGAKAERVFPSFPSKTFPNHYTMMTGLWPESHGITDNSVYDPTISPKLLRMRDQSAGKYYGGEPIWSAYKRLTGKKAHCLFWVGCYYNDRPDVSPDYNQSLPLKDRIDTLMNWLTLNETERPGLITAYLHEPDFAGHHQKSKEEVDKALEEVDKYIDALMERLYKANILECINLVIVSDHGMQKLDKLVEVPNYMNLDGVIHSIGVVTRMHLNNDSYIDEFADQLRCKVEGVKVNTVQDIPLRKHYTKTRRVGDVVIEGKPGTKLFSSHNDEADHGYDYLTENMQTIMFARGPAFKKNVVVPAYQNVQYMNLWLSLLNIEGEVPNNGTIGYFDSILENPPKRENNWKTIEECPSSGLPAALSCGTIDASIWNKLSSKLDSCKPAKSIPINSENHCYQSYCENSIISSRTRTDCRKAVIEVLTSATSPDSDSNSNSRWSFINTKYSNECPVEKNPQFFSAGSDAISHIADAQSTFPKVFLDTVLARLQEKTEKYLQKFRKLFVMSGTATDANRDGIADSEGEPTHFYRILITCQGSWRTSNPPLCKHFNEMKVLAFVFPILNKKSAMDCMQPDELLLDYTATIGDVEKIAGFEFQIGALLHQQNVFLRRNITTALW